MVSSADTTSSFCRTISQASVDVAFRACVRLDPVDSTELVFYSVQVEGGKLREDVCESICPFDFFFFFLQEEELRFLMVTLQ